MNTIVENLDRFIEKVRRGEDTVLMPRQFETLVKIRDFLAAGYTEGHVVNPTGVGKTVVFTKFLEAVLNGSGAHALIAGPTKIILHQNHGKLDAFGDITAGRYYGPEKDLTRQVTVTTYHSLRNLIKYKTIDPKKPRFMILDEAHRAMGEETVSAVDEFENAIKIGFTATPEFHEEKSVADILPFLIDEMSVREAIESDLLSGLRVFAMMTGIRAESIEIKGNDFEETSLTKNLNTPERNRFIAKLSHHPRFEGKRTLVYGASRAHARALTDAFLQENVKAEYIDGFTDDLEREDMFARFKSGETLVLCNVGVLVEGFDEPEAEVCINAVPTLSKVIAEQRGGRILRRSRIKDGKIGYVVEIMDEFGSSPNMPVLFSEIAGAAEILSPSNIDEEKPKVKAKKPSKTGKPRNPKPGTVVEDKDVLMLLTNRNKRQRFSRMFEYAPRGWVYARRLAHELRIKESVVRISADKHAAGTPDWFKRYLTPTDILVVHYHPKLVNLIRREFLKELTGTVTPEEYADQAVITIAKADELLEAADESTESKAIRLGESKYFPLADHELVILQESKRARQEEELLTEEAENLFWNSEDLSDDERERRYWETFEDITSESKGVNNPEDPYDPLLDTESTVRFDEDRHIAIIDDGPDMVPLTPRMRAKVHSWIQLLPKQYSDVIYAIYIREEEPGAILKHAHECRQTITNRQKRGLRLLKSGSRLFYLRDYEALDDEDIRKGFVTAAGLTRLELAFLSPEARKTVARMQLEYLGLQTLALRRRGILWNDLGSASSD